MASMNREKKKAISDRIKANFPHWNVRLFIKDKQTLKVVIVEADIDLLSIADKNLQSYSLKKPFCYQHGFKNGDSINGKIYKYFDQNEEAHQKMKEFMDCVELVGHPFAQFTKEEDRQNFYLYGYYANVHIGGNTPENSFKKT